MRTSLALLLDRLRALKPELRERFGVDAIFVFGSDARGEAGPDSDIDLLVDFTHDASPLFFHSRVSIRPWRRLWAPRSISCPGPA